jgi:hypothetical protein
MAVSEFLPFATTVGANVETQTEFASDPALGPGYAYGQVYSRKVNKLWRQSSFVSAAIARMILEQLSQDVLDNGDLTAFTTNLTQAIKNIGSSVPIYVGDSPPLNPFIGQLWFDTTTAIMLYIYYDGYWVPTVNQKAGSTSSGASVYVGDSPPPGPFIGQLWFDTTTATMLYIYYDGFWIPAINQQGGPGPTGPGVDFPEQTVLTPTTGTTVNVPSVSKVILNPATSLASLILRMPDEIDKRTIRIATRQRIDSLTINALGGQAVDWSVGELPQNGILDLTLVQNLNAWVRA